MPKYLPKRTFFYYLQTSCCDLEHRACAPWIQWSMASITMPIFAGYFASRCLENAFQPDYLNWRQEVAGHTQRNAKLESRMHPLLERASFSTFYIKVERSRSSPNDHSRLQCDTLHCTLYSLLGVERCAHQKGEKALKKWIFWANKWWILKSKTKEPLFGWWVNNHFERYVFEFVFDTREEW